MCSTKLEARLLASSTPPWPPTHLSLYTCHQLSDQRARSWQDRLDSQVRSAHCHSRITAALTPVYSPLQVRSPGQESELIPIINTIHINLFICKIITNCTHTHNLTTLHHNSTPNINTALHFLLSTAATMATTATMIRNTMIKMVAITQHSFLEHFYRARMPRVASITLVC